MKEEIISKNIDACIQNGYFERIPLPILIRILNSPNRVVQNHHLLFKFVIERMNKKDKSENNVIEILPSCLDYTKMTKEEIEELINNEHFGNAFRLSNENDMMKSVFKQLNEISQQKLNYEQKFSELYSQISEIKNSEEKSENFCGELNKKIDLQSGIIQKQESTIKNLQILNEKLEQQIKEIKDKLEQREKEQININNDKNNEHNGIDKSAERITIPISNELYGIFDYLRRNSLIENEIKITFSSNCYDKSLLPLLQIDNTKQIFETNHEPSPWICFEFVNHHIIPTSYTIRSINTRIPDYYHPRSWILEGSNNTINWTNLDEQKDCTYLKGSDLFHTFSIQNSNHKEFKYMKMRLTSPS